MVITTQDEKTIKTAMIAAAELGAPGLVVPTLTLRSRPCRS